MCVQSEEMEEEKCVIAVEGEEKRVTEGGC